MPARNAAGKRKEEAESRAKTRQMFDEEITHLRMGDWRGTKGSEITTLGQYGDLHGTVCVDCPESPNYDPNYQRKRRGV